MDEDLGNKCRNCGNQVSGNFCPYCGQRTSVYKVTFKETLQDLADTLFSVNAPLITTLKMLIINPGRLFTEYLSGQRKKYYRPVTFFILMTVIYLVVREIIKYDPFGSTVLKVSDPSTSQLLTQGRNFMLLNIDKLLFAFALTLGSLMKLFFFKKNTFAEFLAISFYLLGIYTILTILNMFYVQYIDKTIQALHIFTMLLYFIYAMVSYFKKKRLLVIVKSIFVYSLSFFLYGFLAFGISVLIVWINNL
jgi:hypothetical protein